MVSHQMSIICEHEVTICLFQALTEDREPNYAAIGLLTHLAGCSHHLLSWYSHYLSSLWQLE